MPEDRRALKKTLTALQLWGLAVGLVISGEYFGWSYGWSVSGPIGFLVATLVVAVLYTTLIFSFTELATAIPEAGGPFSYTSRAFGRLGGLVTGFATATEFLFAPPAVAMALGGYLHVIFPELSTTYAAIGVMLLFGAINLFPLHLSARFELIVAAIAVLELLVFLLVVGPHFQMENFLAGAWRGGMSGIFASLPFAIWFFLAIEGVAMSAEEVAHPHRDIPRGYIAGIATLVFLAIAIMFAAGGVGDWQVLSRLDYPIPKAVAMALGEGHPWVKTFASIGLFGLIASLNGIILGASRQIFAAARAGLLHQSLCKLSSYGIPHFSVLFTTGFGVVAILSGKTSELITLSAIGAVFMYIMTMASLIRLRRIEPNLHRPFRTPCYPYFPLIAMLLSCVCLGSMLVYNSKLVALFFAGLILVTSFAFRKERGASLGS